jgi:hypothetical protein
LNAWLVLRNECEPAEKKTLVSEFRLETGEALT